MKLRQHLITRFPFGAPGVSLSESAVEQRRSAQLQDMLTMLPCLKTLTGSQITIAHELRNEGWMLSFFLEELPQLALQLTSGLLRGGAFQDHFANDVSILRTQQQSVSARLRRANASSLAAIEDLEVSTFRKLIRRHQAHGTIPLATGPEPINYTLVNTPRVHPTGIPVRIECRVDTLRRSSAEVKVLSSTAMDGSDLLELRSKSSIVLTRSFQHRSMESGQRLLRSLESKETLKLIATLVLNWADGSPDHLELVDFIDKNDSHSPNNRPEPCCGASEMPKP